jgi:hypothetical protein
MVDCFRRVGQLDNLFVQPKSTLPFNLSWYCLPERAYVSAVGELFLAWIQSFVGKFDHKKELHVEFGTNDFGFSVTFDDTYLMTLEFSHISGPIRFVWSPATSEVVIMWESRQHAPRLCASALRNQDHQPVSNHLTSSKASDNRSSYRHQYIWAR